MIGRIWHGWTAPENADAYDALLREEIFTGIQNRNIAGYQGINLFRRDLGREVEFVTIMWFESLEDVRAFAGNDYETAVVPVKARAAGAFRRSFAALRGQGGFEGLMCRGGPACPPLILWRFFDPRPALTFDSTEGI